MSAATASPIPTDPDLLAVETHLLRFANKLTQDTAIQNEIADEISQRQKQLETYRKNYTELKQGIPDTTRLPGTFLLPAIGGITETTGIACPLPGNDIVPSATLEMPVPGAYISAGTWAYPEGGTHLGMDLAAPIGTPVRAPANGYILYQTDNEPADSGYLGNYSGYPAGAGNSILMLCPVQDTLYAVSFAHLSNIHYVKSGQSVTSQDIIALSGNAGNSTGPHTHVEVFELSVSFEQAVQYFSETADFAFGCGWQDPAARSTIARRLRPELVFQ